MFVYSNYIISLSTALAELYVALTSHLVTMRYTMGLVCVDLMCVISTYEVKKKLIQVLGSIIQPFTERLRSFLI